MRGSDLDEQSWRLDMDVVISHGAWYPDDADSLLVGKCIDGVVDAVVGVVVVFVVENDEACAVWVAVVEHQPSIRRFCNENPVPIVWNTRLKLKRAIHNDRCWYVDLHHVPSECVLNMYLARLNLKWFIRISRV